MKKSIINYILICSMSTVILANEISPSLQTNCPEMLQNPSWSMILKDLTESEKLAKIELISAIPHYKRLLLLINKAIEMGSINKSDDIAPLIVLHREYLSPKRNLDYEDMHERVKLFATDMLLGATRMANLLAQVRFRLSEQNGENIKHLDLDTTVNIVRFIISNKLDHVDGVLKLFKKALDEKNKLTNTDYQNILRKLTTR